MNSEPKINDDYFFKKEITFKLSKGYLFSFTIFFLWICINSLILFTIHKNFTFLSIAINKSIFTIEYFIPIFFSGIIVQELIKSLLLKFIAKVKWKEQKAGFSINSFMPYIESKYPINIKIYRYLLIIPNICILQFLWLTYCCNLFEWLIYTGFWLFFSGFDLLTLINIKKIPSYYLIASHDSLPGVNIYDNPFND